MYITITGKDPALIRNAWDTLKEGAEIHMELRPAFFAALHGSLQDRFGVNWMFTLEK
jgi:PhnB protein